MYEEDDLLDLSGLQHLAYCERQWALIHLEGLWGDSADTVRGDAFHERAHLEGYTVAKGTLTVRALPLACYALGVKGQADIVEFELSESDEGWRIDLDALCLSNVGERALVSSVRPVEYKVGKPKVEAWDRVQVCAQGMCLEEAFGIEVPEGALFYGETRHRERVALASDLRKETERLAVRMHELFELGITPRAAKRSRCSRCSLLSRCTPEVFAGDPSTYWEDAGFAMTPTSIREGSR